MVDPACVRNTSGLAPCIGGASPDVASHPREGTSGDGSDDGDTGRLGALGALADLEPHVLVLFEAAEPAALDLRVVNEKAAEPSEGAMKPNPFSS